MTNISLSPLVPRFVTKAILAPSGDQAGEKSPSGLFVRFVCPLPSAFTEKTSELPVEARAKAIFPFRPRKAALAPVPPPSETIRTKPASATKALRLLGWGCSCSVRDTKLSVHLRNLRRARGRLRV